MEEIVQNCVSHKITNPLAILLAPKPVISYAYLVGKIKRNTAQVVSIFPHFILLKESDKKTERIEKK